MGRPQCSCLFSLYRVLCFIFKLFFNVTLGTFKPTVIQRRARKATLLLGRLSRGWDCSHKLHILPEPDPLQDMQGENEVDTWEARVWEEGGCGLRAREEVIVQWTNKRDWQQKKKKRGKKEKTKSRRTGRRGEGSHPSLFCLNLFSLISLVTKDRNKRLKTLHSRDSQSASRQWPRSHAHFLSFWLSQLLI